MAPKHLHLFLRIYLFFFPFFSLSLWLDWLSCTQPSAACVPVREDRLPHTHALTESCTGAHSHPLIHTHTPDLTHTPKSAAGVLLIIEYEKMCMVYVHLYEFLCISENIMRLLSILRFSLKASG